MFMARVTPQLVAFCEESSHHVIYQSGVFTIDALMQRRS